MVGKKIHELRVVDLRAQLEKRGLDIKGNKAALVEKLRKAMEEEGISPDADIIDGDESQHNNSSITKEESDLGEESEAGDVAQTEEISVKVESTEKSTNGNDDKKAVFSSNDNDDDVEIKEEEEEEEIAKTFGDSLRETMETIEQEKKESAITTTTDDDHEELHLTVGEEEDKFIIEGVDSITNTGTEEVKVEEKDGESEELVKIESSTIEVKEEVKILMEVGEPCSTLETKAEVDDDVEDISEDTQDDSKEGKNSENNEEAGTNELKSKDEERNTLLVTGLTSLISATEIKSEFKKQGKIGGVKIISNANDPEGSRFALVSVCSSEDAQNCISTMDGTNLRGRIIHVEKAEENMLSADWVKKDSHRESKKRDSSSSKRSSPNSSIVSGTPGNGNQSTNKPTEKSESSSRKKNNEQVTPPTEQSNVESNTTTANSSSERKEKDSSSRNTHSTSKITERRFNAERREPNRARGQLPGVSRTIQRRPTRDSRPVFLPRNSRHHEELKRGGGGGDQYRRFQDSRGRRGHHQTSYIRRSRSPVERIPFRRGSDERRINRQAEQLTFEDIYDARQREKMRETERERREAERRRLEEEERQRLLDEEFRRLAKERERIEQEKAELKRQKERMIMEEREKQKQEQAEIEREKALLAQKAKGKRSYPDDGYGSVGHYSKKTTLDDRHISRHASSFLDLRSESDKHRSYRKDDHSRYPETDSQSSPIRNTIRNAPTRDRRSPSWERGDRHKSRDSRDSRGTDRHSSRHDKDHGKSRDDRKTSSSISSVGSSATASSSRIPYDSASQYSSTISMPRLTTGSKALDTYFSTGTRDSRWPSSIYSGDTHSTTMNPIRNETWQPTTRDTSWLSSDRVATRPMTEMPDRWTSTNTGTSSGRLGLPIAPPPPVFTNATNSLGLGSSISGGNFNSSLSSYSNPYDYKMTSISSHRR